MVLSARVFNDWQTGQGDMPDYIGSAVQVCRFFLLLLYFIFSSLGNEPKY